MKNLVFLTMMLASTFALAEQNRLLVPVINAQEISAVVEAKINTQVDAAMSELTAEVDEDSAAQPEEAEFELSVANR